MDQREPLPSVRFDLQPLELQPSTRFRASDFGFLPVWWPIRNQILVPFTAVLLVAVAVTSVSSAVLASRRAEQAIVGQLNRMIETLSPSSFPWSRNVLDMMRGLSGAEFVVYDDRPALTTLPADVPLP